MRSVLVVDDEPSILLALEFMMKNAGFEVRTARDGDEALRALGEKKPDLSRRRDLVLESSGAARRLGRT